MQVILDQDAYLIQIPLLVVSKLRSTQTLKRKTSPTYHKINQAWQYFKVTVIFSINMFQNET